MFHLMKPIPYKFDSMQHVSNIVASVVLKRLNIDKTYLYKDVFIREDSTLESISNQYYGDVQFWWVIQLVNDIINPYTNLPMDNDVLVKYTRKKYGNENNLHWFVDNRTGRICDDRSSIEWFRQWKTNTLPEYIIPVSHLDYETERNSKHTRIKIINPTFIHAFVEVFRETVDAE